MVLQILTEPDDHGGFAGAPGGDIAHADDRDRQQVAFEPIVIIEPVSHSDQRGVDADAQEAQYDSQESGDGAFCLAADYIYSIHV